ncbi:MAG: hypothetical protein FWF59_03850 [Turicibacter sp.]|nr:hypothetical protein [Turicibacter sp.]
MKKYEYELKTGCYDRCAKPDYQSASFYPSYEEALVSGKEWDSLKTGLSNYNARVIVAHEIKE